MPHVTDLDQPQESQRLVVVGEQASAILQDGVLRVYLPNSAPEDEPLLVLKMHHDVTLELAEFTDYHPAPEPQPTALEPDLSQAPGEAPTIKVQKGSPTHRWFEQQEIASQQRAEEQSE